MSQQIKFGTDGWRGHVGENYTFANVRRCTQGFASYLAEQGFQDRWVIVGHDRRYQAEQFAAAAAEVLAGNGFKVYLTAGPTPTPVISYAVVDKKAAAAINITASHNPYTDNGFKVRDENGGAIDPEGLIRIESNIPESEDEVKRTPLKDAIDAGAIVMFDAAPAYITHIETLIDLQPIKDAGLRVMVDPMWGNGAGWFPKLIGGGATEVFEISTNPDVAFTTASIAKIPIMTSIFRRINEDEDAETINLLQNMIIKSGNDPADWVMERVIHPSQAPLEVTDDMQALGLENTFLAGEFWFGAPLLKVYQTPANQREDISTDPDIYNQSTPSDLGMLLEDIYLCADNGQGTFKAVFSDEITQTECQMMLNYLSQNKLGTLLERGVPDVTEVAHKHGWVTYNGIMQTLGDAGIIFSPGGDYVLVIFLYHPQQLIWDNASFLVGQLSEAIYNFYNQNIP